MVIGTQTASTNLPIPACPASVETRPDLADEALAYARATRSENTLRAYASDWADFTAWAAARDLMALPADPSTVALYLTDLAHTVRPTTITRRMASISVEHQHVGLASPTTDPRVREIIRGIRRTHGTARKEAAPAGIGEVRRMTARLPDTIAGTRDRALLLIGFAGALRRSELVALDLDDVEDHERGLTLHLRGSKTDQEREGRRVAIPVGTDAETCPVRALRAWLTSAQIDAGPLFRSVDRHGNVATVRMSDRGVNLVVKRAARASRARS